MTVKDFVENCKLISNKLYDIDLYKESDKYCFIESIVYNYEDEEKICINALEKYGDCEIKRIEIYTDEQFDGTFNLTFDLYIEGEE